jgi:hypothetical protein
MTSEPTHARTIIDQPDRGRLEVWPLPADEASLWNLLRPLFEEHWSQITFGPLIPGAAWEVRAPNAPTRTTLKNGYLTVDFGPWHFHICIGQFNGVPPEQAAARRTGRAEFYRRLNNDDQPVSWGLCLFNNGGAQQMTVLLPNPLLTPEQKIAETPDWSRLALWDALRKTHLGLDPDPIDRSAPGFGRG